MESPNPVPCPTGLVVKKGSKTCLRFSGGIPGPLSENAIAHNPSSEELAEMRTHGLSTPSTASSAFTSKLTNICCTACG